MAFAAAARLAPAKVNLFLHVGPPAADGYHPVASLMVFADVGDRVRLEPAEGQALELAGEFAPELAGARIVDNLVWRAAQALLAHIGRADAGFRLTLEKALPVAAGLGGGSSDAGAALQLLRQALAPDLPDPELAAIAGALGADGPACLFARPVIGTGRGDRLADPPRIPLMHAVLVNPRRPSPTGAVYRAYDEAPSGAADLPPLAPYPDADALIRAAQSWRNDLEAPAARLSPPVAEALALVSALPGVELTRLSGSGATVFALTAGERQAAEAAAAARALRPDWWVRTCRLGGPWEAPTL